MSTRIGVAALALALVVVLLGLDLAGADDFTGAGSETDRSDEAPDLAFGEAASATEAESTSEQPRDTEQPEEPEQAEQAEQSASAEAADGDEPVDAEADPTDPEPERPAIEVGLAVDVRASGRPWSDIGASPGLLTFRGNPSRTFYGRGPIPESPEVLWSRTIGCSNSSVGGEAKVWCGTGWTGQPAVFPAPDQSGAWWLGIGGYNRNVNFFDPDTGQDVLPAFPTGDIIKGTITVDPDGFPLVYTGSRDNFFHVVAIDGPEPRELWRLSATEHSPTLWNDDWDSSALVVDDHLIVGGENSRFYVVELNRAIGADGLVTVDPDVVFTTEGWDDQLLADLGDRQVSIENSVAMAGSVVYFANSGGLVQGWDLAPLESGNEPVRVFRFWLGDDTDATVVIDDEGMLYAVSQFERGNQRSRDLGQVFKIDPSKPDDPLVWSREASDGLGTGVWATPALWDDLVIVSTDDGRVLGLDRADGTERWVIELPRPLWSSPVVVDGTLLQGDCNGVLHAFDLGRGRGEPVPRWQIELGGCIESTPAVWDGQIFVGTRTGEFYAIGDR